MERVQEQNWGLKPPQTFRFPIWARGILLLISGITAAYSLYFLFNFVHSDTPIFFKILPTLILYIALDTVFRHLTNLNKISFTDDKLVFSYLAKKSLEIPYHNISSIDMYKKITHYIKVSYMDLQGNQKQFVTNASFPKMLTVLMMIYDLSPNLELDPKMKEAFEYIRIKAELETKKP